MKRIILTILMSLMTYTSINATHWLTSFEDAQKLAIATNKLIVIDFWATWCKPCLMMETDTWNKEEVKELMNNFIPLKIDIDNDRRLASKFSARRIPYIVIVDPNGEIVYEDSGYKDKNKMIKILKKYTVNMKPLQKDFLEYRKKQTPEVSMRIAEKYFDYAIYVDKSVKVNFLKLGKKYLKKTKEKVTKKEYKDKYEQKSDLLTDVYYNLIRGKYKKAIKKLDTNFEEQKIQGDNRGFYSFLYFSAYNKLKDKVNASIWYEKLKKDKGVKLYLFKSRKL